MAVTGRARVLPVDVGLEIIDVPLQVEEDPAQAARNIGELSAEEDDGDHKNQDYFRGTEVQEAEMYYE